MELMFGIKSGAGEFINTQAWLEHLTPPESLT